MTSIRFALSVATILACTTGSSVAEEAGDWGEPKGGLRTRLAAERQAFRPGEPIPMKLLIENVSDEDKRYTMSEALGGPSLRVVDEHGKDVPYIGGLAQVMVRPRQLKPGETGQVRAFNLAGQFYLRRPGKYSVRSLDHPASGVLKLQVAGEPAESSADGDPVGRLLPLVKERWWLVPQAPKAKLNPGGNRAPVKGQAIYLHYTPTGYKKDSGIVWLWLTEEPAAEQPAPTEWPPATEYLGKVDRWHVYAHVTEHAQKAWPTAKEDVKEALATGPKPPATRPVLP